MKHLHWFGYLALSLCACAGPPPGAVGPTTPAEVPSTTGAAVSDVCVLECGTAALVAQPIAGEMHAQSVRNVDLVFASMHADLLACYTARVANVPNARAELTLDIVINADGRVRSVTSTGGAMLGESGRQCVIKRVEGAVFEPVRQGGTLRIQVPLTFRRGASEST